MVRFVVTPLVLLITAAPAWIIAAEVCSRFRRSTMKQFIQKSHVSLSSLLPGVRDRARTFRHVPLLDELSECSQALQFSLMAPFGHTSTQAPQPQHTSALTLTATSPRVIASVGQTAWQAPQGVHASSSTHATGEVLLADVGIRSPGGPAI